MRNGGRGRPLNSVVRQHLKSQPQTSVRVLALPTNWKRWAIEFAIAMAILGIISAGWDTLPKALIMAAGVVFAALIIRGMIWSWREFKRQNHL